MNSHVATDHSRPLTAILQPEDKAQLPVEQSYHRLLAEDDLLGSLLGPGQFDEDNAYDKRFDHDA